ncbi:MAG: GerMN domain-containing protein [Tissierellia bacterium]|nr:GerMN domain-containing protein [Tissierellia bacterium]
MKKRLIYISLLLVISLIFTACKVTNDPRDEEGDTNKEELTEEITLKSYYPFKENMKKRYEGVGNEFAEQTTFIEFVDGDRAQIKTFNPGTVIVEVIEYKDGVIKEIFREGEFYHIENMLDSNNESNNIILKEPLEVGTSWTTMNGFKKSITGIDVEVETPYKRFKALEVTTEFGEGRKQLDYYVKDIGHVASIYRDGEFEVKRLLRELEMEPYQMEINFYYPFSNDIKTGYIAKNIVFNTNDSIEKIMEYNLKNPEDDRLIPVISKDTNINSIELDRGNGIVRVDFSKELLKYTATGSSMEKEILRSIVNTFGSFYGVDRVYISTDGNPYSSGHFSIDEYGFFTVDYEGVEKIEDL